MYKILILFLALISNLLSSNISTIQNSLSNHEKSILLNKTYNICVRSNHYPIIYLRNNKLDGVAGNIFKLINKQININYQILEFENHNELDNSILNNKCDILLPIRKDQTTFKNIKTSDSIFTNYFAILGNLDSYYFEDNTSIKNKIFYVKDKVQYKLLRNYNEKLNIVLEPNLDKIIEEVFTNSNAHYFNLQIILEQIINKNGMNNLKINDIFENINKVYGSIGVNENNETLLKAINIALKNIPNEIKEEQFNKYRFNYITTQKTDWTYVWYFLILIFVIFIYFLIKNNKLEREKRILQETINKELSAEKKLKDRQLKELNENLERKVQEQVEEINKNQAILIHQDRLAQIGSMVSMIAHQWRQPLNALAIWRSNLFLIMDENNHKDQSYEMIKEKMITIEQNLSETIDDFANFYKTESVKKEFYIKKCIDDTFTILALIFQNNGIDFTVKLNNDIKLNSFKNELQQTLLAIITNSLDELLQIEDITHNKTITVDVTNKDENIIIKIIDTGRGISKSIQNKIFDPYFTTKSQLNGTGIGLYMSKMIVEKKLNGLIEYNTSNKGTEFIITIPKNVD